MPHVNVNWSDSSLTSAITQQVYVRQRWADAWTLDSTIWCDSVTGSLLPSIPTASFVREYGPHIEANAQTWNIRNKLDLAGYYVKVVITTLDGFLTWYGFIDEITDEQGYSVSSPIDGTQVASGCQSWVAYDMSQVLAYTTITRSRWFDDLTTPGTPVIRWSGSGITFNSDGNGNRSADKQNQIEGNTSTPEAYVFEPEAYRWGQADVLEYLATFAGPRDENDDIKIPFRFDNLTSLDALESPQLHTDGKTVMDVMRQFVNPATLRQFGTSIDETTTPHTVVLTLYDLDNSNPNTISLQTQGQDTSVTVRQSLSEISNRVVVYGDYQTSRFSASFQDAGAVVDRQFKYHWLDADETLYDDAAQNEAGYGALSGIKKQEANQRVRARPILRDVHRLFKLNYEELTALPEGALPAEEIFVDSANNAYVPYYELVNITDAPRLWLNESGLGNFYGAEHMGGSFPKFAASAEIDTDSRSIALNVQGAPQHVIAHGIFTGDSSVDDFSFVYGKFSYRDAVVTLTLADDRRVSSIVNGNVTNLDALRTKVIFVDKGFGKLRTCRGTVEDYDYDNTPIYETAGTDDAGTDALDEIADSAKWFLVPRKTLSLRSARVSSLPRPGMLVTLLNAGTAQAETINTVITEVQISMSRGENGPASPPSYSLKTAVGELDPLAVN